MNDETESNIPIATLLCNFCGAGLGSEDAFCCRCGSPVNSARSAQPADDNPYKSPASNDIALDTKRASTLVSILMTGGLFILLFAIGSHSPGLAILLGFSAIPAWARTAVLAWTRVQSGSQMSTAEKLARFSLYTLVMSIIVVVLLICVVALIFFACLTALGQA